jgi:carbamoyltransferase
MARPMGMRGAVAAREQGMYRLRHSARPAAAGSHRDVRQVECWLRVLKSTSQVDLSQRTVESGRYPKPNFRRHMALVVLWPSSSPDLLKHVTAILGLSAFYHDSAAALVVDGEIVAAAQEERFTRKKHDHEFPAQAVAYCLREAGLSAEDLDYVGFYEKPLLKFDRLCETYLSFAPRGLRSFLTGMPQWYEQKLHLRREIRRGLGTSRRHRYVFTEHHESHAASAFFPSPFEEAAILTLDGVGEWTTASFGTGRGNRIELTHEMRFPHSLGLLYSAFTYYCGFKVNSGEYKLMGLAPYGRPIYTDLILKHLIDLKDDGSFRMDLSYFDYPHGLRMTSSRFDDLFGGPARQSEAALTDREMDIAASIQAVTEEIMLRAARHVFATTGMRNLCLAGGVALNCVGNGRVLRDGPFERLWIQPAAGDAGGALGTALFIWHQLLDRPRTVIPSDAQKRSLLGPSVEGAETARELAAAGAAYRLFDSDEALCEHVAALIASGKVVGWMQGRMEFGPRALGNRSILGDARNPEMQRVMNVKIKFRESFRPFAPSVLRDRVHEYFDLTAENENPYMLMVAPVAAERRLPDPGTSATGIDKLNELRSQIPAVTHVDYSARVQTVDEGHGRYYQLLRAFERQTGCPVIINTSFNVRGEPIVCTPAEAYRCFLSTGMDVLVVDRAVMVKEDHVAAAPAAVKAYLGAFALD